MLASPPAPKTLTLMSDPASLQALAAPIRASGALGRSQLIQKLFDFLVLCSATGRTPKEAEVAIEVFGKAVSFDGAQDAMVGVYVHKLRRKLEEYYASAGRSDPFQLTIPKGAYRIVISDHGAVAFGAAADAAAAEDPGEVADTGGAVPVRPATPRRWLLPVLAASLVINLLVLGTLFWHSHRQSPINPLLTNPLWSRMLDTDRPLL